LALKAAAAQHECVHVVRLDLEHLVGVGDDAVVVVAPAREDDGALPIRAHELGAPDLARRDQSSAGFDLGGADRGAEASALVVGAPPAVLASAGGGGGGCGGGGGGGLGGKEGERGRAEVGAGGVGVVPAAAHAINLDRCAGAPRRTFEIDPLPPLHRGDGQL